MQTPRVFKTLGVFVDRKYNTSMGKLIAIIGNNASGKTTLAKALCRHIGNTPYLESHEERPYQTLFSQDVRRYAFPNQIDYLLTRAEQERAIRAGELAGVQDGGLDQDYQLYTRLFHHKGFLDDKEYDLCRRTYLALRAALPPPDVIIRLNLPLNVLRARLIERGRTIDIEKIVTVEDLPLLEAYLDEWLAGIHPARLLAVDAGEDDPAYRGVLEGLAARVEEKVGIES